MKAGIEPADGPGPERAAAGRVDRLAAVARGLSVGLRRSRRRHVAVLDARAGPTCARRSSAGCRRCPVVLGEIQARSLGAAVEALDPERQRR